MSLRVLFRDGIYPEVAAAVYRGAPGLAEATWEAQNDALLGARFACWDAWAVACRGHGVPAVDLLVEVPALDAAVARTPGIIDGDTVVVDRHMRTPRSVLAALKARARALVGMVSSAAPDDDYLRLFDLIVSPFPHFVRDMAARGLPVRYLPLAFDERRLGRQGDVVLAARPRPCTFVGGLGITRHWAAGQHAVAAVAEALGADFEWWGYRGPEAPAAGSALARAYRGEAWGDAYFARLAESRLTVNRHGEVHSAPRPDRKPGEPSRDWWACNMRLFEATGMGCLLLTEEAPNLRAEAWDGWPEPLFLAGDEVVTFRNPRELAALATHYLRENPERAAIIAAAGQARCLNNHLYRHRAAVLLDWLADLPPR